MRGGSTTRPALKLLTLFMVAAAITSTCPLHGISVPVAPGAARRVAVPTGPVGSSAPLWVKAGARIEKLVVMIRASFSVIVDAWRAVQGPTPVITSGTDGVHGSGSLHYSGRAIDLRANNIQPAQARAARDHLQSRLGRNYDVIYETFPGNPSNNHIHLEYDPKEGAAVFAGWPLDHVPGPDGDVLRRLAEPGARAEVLRAGQPVQVDGAILAGTGFSRDALIIRLPGDRRLVAVISSDACGGFVTEVINLDGADPL